MAGSIAALIAIAGVLFTLNNNKARDFKDPATSRQQPAAASSQTEVLLPSNVPASAAKPTDNTRTTPALEDSEPLVASAPRARPPKPREETEPALIDEQPNANKDKSKKTETARRQQEDLADRNAKPTAEQILNSGSIEKAREVARQEAQAKRAKQRAAEEAQANKADRAPAQARESKSDQPAAAQNKTGNKSAGNKTDRTTVQAGAYNTRQAAEAQRAKLALMGVNTQIVEVESNGKTLYRVQTRGMDSKRANQVRETLQQNGVNSIPRKQ